MVPNFIVPSLPLVAAVPTARAGGGRGRTRVRVGAAALLRPFARREWAPCRMM